MKTPNTNIDRPDMSSEEINAGKNFNQVLDTYVKTTKPFFKQKWFIANSFLIVAIGIVAIIYFNSNQTTEIAANVTQPVTTTTVAEYQPEKETQPFVSPPIEGLNVAFSSYMVESRKGKTIKHKTGSFIDVPKDAFVNESGELVKGKVEIKYREFKDVAEIFASGIPMTYQQDGEELHFESAGMVEILAYQDGKPVYMNPEKKIDIKMTTKYAGTQYNLYTLDTTNREWVYEGKDKVIVEETETSNNSMTIVEADFLINDWNDDSFASDKTATAIKSDKELQTIEKEIVVIQKDIKKIETTEPLKPVEATGKRFRFDIDFKKEEFPEMKVYTGLEFEIGDENKNFDPKLTNKEWQDILLTKSEDKYILELKRYLTSKEYKPKKEKLVKERDYQKEIRKTKSTNKKATKGSPSIKGKILDQANGEPLPFANIIVTKSNKQVTGTMSDFDGKFTVSNLPAGKYTLHATYVGYSPLKIDNIIVNDKKITFVPDLKLSQGAGISLEEFEVSEYETLDYLTDSSEGPMEIRKFIVYPVFVGENYIIAKEDFDKKFEQYSDKLNARKEDERLKQEAYEKRVAEIKAENERRRKEWEAQATNRDRAQKTSNQIYRAFSAYKFGTLNCDSPIKRPSGQTVLAKYLDEKMKDLSIVRLFLVEKSRNAVFPYNSYNNELTYNPRADNYLLGVTHDNKVITFTQKQFKEIPKATKTYDFEMSSPETQPTSVDDLKKCISFL